MIVFITGGALVLGMLSFFKFEKEHFDPEDWADRKEYLKFWRDVENWKSPVRWA